MVNWELDHLGTQHPPQELDNMADDVPPWPPPTGRPAKYFENELKDHIRIQRQGGPMQLYNTLPVHHHLVHRPGYPAVRRVFGGM